MRSNLKIAAALTAAVLLALALLAGCVTDTPAPEGSTQNENGEKTKEEMTQQITTGAPPVPGEPASYPVIHKTVYNASLDWNRLSQKIPGTSRDLVWWNLNACQKLSTNFLNVFPNYRDGDKSVPGMQLLFGSSIMEYTAKGVEATHAMGITLVSSLPMCLLHKANYAAYGLDYRPYAAVKPGTKAISEGSDYAYACINNPLFQDLVRQYTLAAARTGYDGMFFDANPYAYGLKFNCGCKYCVEGWKSYSAGKTGAEIPLLTNEPNLSREKDRLFMQWRRDIYIDFVLQLRDECRQINPAFSVWPNFGFNGNHTYYYTLKGLEDAMCEYGSNVLVNPGAESTLYAFAMYEAANPARQLMTQFNSVASQASPDYKWYTAYVEAIAGSGALMTGTTSTATSTFFAVIDGCNRIKAADPEAFSDSANAADVAVVYSWQNVDAYLSKLAGNVSYSVNTSRKVAGTLAARGVPFAYVMPEAGPDIGELMRYRIVIAPDLRLLDDAFEALLYEYVQAGGELLICGSTFAACRVEEYGYKYPARADDVLKAWTGTAYSDAATGSSFRVGKGGITVVKTYISGAAESVATENPVYTEALERLGIGDLVRVSGVTVGKVETTLRSDATGSRWWLNLITFASEGVYSDKPVTVTVRIPEGQTVTSVTAVSPTAASEALGLEWSQDGRTLTVRVVAGLWTMLRIEKN
jgi:hypothetical protein